MVTYIIVTHNKQNGIIETSKPFFSHEEAEKEMWNGYATALKINAEAAKELADVNNIDYSDYYINDVYYYETEIHSVLFNEDDMIVMQILEAFYKTYPEFNDYKYAWRAKYQDMLVYLITKLLPCFKSSYNMNEVNNFVEDVLIGEEMHEAALAELGGDNERTEEMLRFIYENPNFAKIFMEEYGIDDKSATLCGLLVLSNGDEKCVERVRKAMNEWCVNNGAKPIFVEPQYVYRVAAYYDMDIMTDEEIIQEIYATEELAKKRVRYLIDTYKNECHAIEDCEPYGGEWDEDEYRLYAYIDSEWNVDISYTKEEVRTNC